MRRRIAGRARTAGAPAARARGLARPGSDPARRARIGAALAGLALSGFAVAAHACELPGGEAQMLQGATHTVLYRAATPRVGEHFSVDFAVCPAPEAVRVDAWMPEHRHGMNYKPSITVQGVGRYRAQGLMLHMAGRWEIVFEVRSGSQTERLAASLRLE
jgi:hypothetical protein